MKVFYKSNAMLPEKISIKNPDKLATVTVKARQ
jgi:hypothetical protein